MVLLYLTVKSREVITQCVLEHRAFTSVKSTTTDTVHKFKKPKESMSYYSILVCIINGILLAIPFHLVVKSVRFLKRGFSSFLIVLMFNVHPHPEAVHSMAFSIDT